MTSTSSKALPYVGVAMSFIFGILAVLGYGEQLNSVLALLVPVLGTVTGGGLINAQIKASLEKAKTLQDEGHLKALVEEVVAEVNKPKSPPTT